MRGTFDRLQEYQQFKKFGDSLLSRSSKMTDLIGQLEAFVDGKAEDNAELKRIKQSST